MIFTTSPLAVMHHVRKIAAPLVDLNQGPEPATDQAGARLRKLENAYGHGSSPDSPLEGTGFEPSVPPFRSGVPAPTAGAVRRGLFAGESWIRTISFLMTSCGPVMDTMQRSECESDQPRRYGHLAMASSCNVAIEVGSAGAGRVRIETASLYPAPPPSGMLKLSTSFIHISGREAPWFSPSSCAAPGTTPPNRAGARIEQAVVCRAVRRPLLVGGTVHRDPNCSYAG